MSSSANPKSAPPAASPAPRLEYSLPARVLKFTEARRYVQLRIEAAGNHVWLIAPEAVAEWIDRDGYRFPVEGAERAGVVARIVAEARALHLWLGVKGQPVEPRPSHLPLPPETRALPALPPEDEPECADGEDVPTVVPTGVRELSAADAGDDPELRAFAEYEAAANRTPSSTVTLSAADCRDLLAELEAVLAELRPMAAAGFPPAESIVRQLEWSRAMVAGEAVEPAPGPFTMGLIATREFDMYGSQPELASRINRLEERMQRATAPSP